MSESPESVKPASNDVLDLNGYLIYASEFERFLNKLIREYENDYFSSRVDTKLKEIYTEPDVYFVHFQLEDKPLPCQLLRSGQAWIEGEAYFELSLKFRPTSTHAPEPSPDDIQSPLDDIRQSMQDAD
jgi:hypothetical protein